MVVSDMNVDQDIHVWELLHYSMEGTFIWGSYCMCPGKCDIHMSAKMPYSRVRQWYRFTCGSYSCVRRGHILHVMGVD